jgi:hypothetical protein
MAQPIQLLSQPGIDRDGTRFDSQSHNDGQWVRWHRGRARKMRGYQRYSEFANGISRGMHGINKNGVTYVHSGAADRLEAFSITGTNTIIPAIDRTPAGFVANADHLWTFAASFDTLAGTGGLRFLAHAAPNARNIDSSVQGQIYYGDPLAGVPLTKVQNTGVDFVVSGGVWQVGPYAFAGDNDGNLFWSVPSKPSDFTGTGSAIARPTTSKILTGKRMRGAGAPACLIWSLDTLLRASFVGGSVVWSFDEIAESSLLSPQAVIEAEGVFFWPDATQRFMTYNGMPRELPNTMNLEFFFDNLNWDYRGRVHGYYNAKWGELVWHAPLFGATECNWAIIFNIRENKWYDTPLPNGGRSAVITPSIYRFPIMAGTKNYGTTLSPKYGLWQHEIGTDEVDGDKTLAIKSFVESGDISMLKGDKPTSDAVAISMIELDIEQKGDMVVTITGNKNARGPDMPAPERHVVTADQQAIPVKEERRQMRVRWESNTLGGDFEMGLTVAHIDTTKSGVLD